MSLVKKIGKRLGTTLMFVLALTGITAFGLWTMSFQGQMAIVVDSQEPVTYSSTLDVNTIDATNGSATISDYVDVLNNNGDATFTITNTNSTTDISDTCTEYQDDITLTIGPTSFALGNGQTERVWVNVTVEQGACPQIRNVTLTINGTYT